MASRVFYRKWRPRTLSEVVGQEHVTRTLKNAVASGRIAHAYLFCGPRGTGKTSTGRILAKAANCLSPVDGEPCNTCQMCQSINEGSAPDIIEIDAASKTGVDDIRDLREKANYAPNIARYKVYIIDEVHMISTAASNAFLKTLEEPPPHAIFVLATTELHKILPTIMSRCQRFDFHRLSQSAVISKLQFIAEQESIEIQPEALRLIARTTTGSLRDAENLLEQLTAYYGSRIDLHQVQAMLGISGDQRVRDLAGHIIAQDIPEGLRTINSVSNDGIDLRQFNREMVDYLRDIMLVKSGSESIVDATAEEKNELIKLAGSTSLDYLLNAVKHFGAADLRLDNYSPLPLELALIDTVLSCTLTVYEQKATGHIANMAETAKSEAARKRQQEEKGNAASPQLKPPAHLEVSTQEAVAKKPPLQTTHPGSKKTVEGQDVAVEAGIDAGTMPEQSAGDSGEEAPPPVRRSAEAKIKLKSAKDIEFIRDHWKEFVASMKGEGSRGNLDAFLRSACEPVSISFDSSASGGGTPDLTVGFYAKFHKDYIDDPKYKFLVEKKLKEFFGQSYKIQCIIIERKKEGRQTPAKDSFLAQAAMERGAKKLD